MKAHSTAIISSGAKICDNVEIGPYAVIDSDVKIGDDCFIDSHVSIKSGVRIGNNVRIHHAAAIGGPPQDLKYAGEPTYLFIGNNVVIREFVTLNRGTTARGKSAIGDDCLLMAYSHIAHDCIIGNKVILANNVQVGGHVTIGDWVTLGGSAGVHQFCRVGDHSMVGASRPYTQDILPFSLVAGYPVKCYGVNIVGLRRRGFSSHTINTLKTLFRFLMSKKMTGEQIQRKIDEEVEKIPEVVKVLEFIDESERGVIR